MGSTAAASVRLLGAAQVSLGGSVFSFRPDKRHQLLAYLAHRGDWVSREGLTALFWPESFPEVARNNLRQLLSRVRALDGVLGLEVERERLRWAVDTDVAPFNRAVGDWPEHLEKLGAFWSSVMLTSGRYKGSPMAAHLRHAEGIEPAMFGRWLELWRETAAETLAPDDAARVVAKAERIAESLQLALYFRIEGDGGRRAA